jgi:hypothetical protein
MRRHRQAPLHPARIRAANALAYRLLSVDGWQLHTGVVGAHGTANVAFPALCAGTYLLYLATTDGTAGQVVRVVRE